MRKVKRMIGIVLGLMLLLVVATYHFLQTTPFGALPAGERLKRIRKSPHWREGAFQNLHLTPDYAEGRNFFSVMWSFFFNKSPRNLPDRPISSVYTDLHTLDKGREGWVWMGHSSYFLQLSGRRILVDPVLTGYASPIKMASGKAFEGADGYRPKHIPAVDYVFISHDHWDHLDYATIVAIEDRVGMFVTGLGTGAHLERWGVQPNRIVELDWNESKVFADGFKFTALPARHFSGRGLKRNQALWISIALETPGKKLYLGGDSGYDHHFKEIGQLMGGFDLAFLECGQYDYDWKYIHMMPEEVVQACRDLGAKTLMPVHREKFSLAKHAWDEPWLKVSAEAERHHLPILHPKNGEWVDWNNWLEAPSKASVQP